MKRKILIVDDEQSIADLVEVYLSNEGMEVLKCYNGQDALDCIKKEALSLAVLDVMLPDIDGYKLCQEIRKEHFYPVIMLTARTEDTDKILGLTIGADDYVTKPFDPDEVAARIHAVLRRAAGASAAAGAGGVCPDDEALVHRDLRLDVARRRVTLGDAEVALTAHEFDILHVLMRSPDKVFSRELLYELVWKNGYYGEQNAVNVHVSNIRKKLAAAGGAGDYIKTVWGIGFKLA